MIGGLVQQQQIGTPHQRLGEVQPHTPSSRQRRERHALVGAFEPQATHNLRGPRRRRIGVDIIELAVDQRLAVTVAGPLRHVKLRLQAPQLDIAVQDVLDGDTIRDLEFLGHSCNAQTLRNGDVAGIRVQISGYQLQQTALSGTVAAGDTDLVPEVDVQVDVAEHRAAAAEAIDFLELQHRL